MAKPKKTTCSHKGFWIVVKWGTAIGGSWIATRLFCTNCGETQNIDPIASNEKREVST